MTTHTKTIDVSLSGVVERPNTTLIIQPFHELVASDFVVGNRITHTNTINFDQVVVGAEKFVARTLRIDYSPFWQGIFEFNRTDDAKSVDWVKYLELDTSPVNLLTNFSVFSSRLNRYIYQSYKLNFLANFSVGYSFGAGTPSNALYDDISLVPVTDDELRFDLSVQLNTQLGGTPTNIPLWLKPFTTLDLLISNFCQP